MSTPEPAIKRIIVTGAQGFIGRYFAAHCLAEDANASVLALGRSKQLDGYFTHMVSRGSEKVKAPVPASLHAPEAGKRYRYISVDVRDDAVLAKLIQEFCPTVIVHLAGSLRDEALEQLLKNNVIAVERLFEAAAFAGTPPTIVLGSTAFVYGVPRRHQLPLREDTVNEPHEFYGLTKRLAEDVAGILSRRYGIPVIFARIFQVVGAGQDERHLCGWLASQFAAICRGVRAPKIDVGPLTATRDFVDVRDVVAALYILMNRGETGKAYNVASGIETNVQRVFDELLDLSGLRSGVDVVKRPARKEDTPALYADINRLVSLGYEPHYDLRASLSDLLRYYLDTIWKNEEH